MSKTKNIQVGLLAAALLGGGTPGAAHLPGFRRPRARRDRGPDYRHPKARELARIEWRQRVDEAARAWSATRVCRDYSGPAGYGIEWVSPRAGRRRRWLLKWMFAVSPHAEMDQLDASLAAPKSWRKPWTPADIGRSPCWLAWSAPPWHCPHHSPRLSRAQRKRKAGR